MKFGLTKSVEPPPVVEADPDFGRFTVLIFWAFWELFWISAPLPLIFESDEREFVFECLLEGIFDNEVPCWA